MGRRCTEREMILFALLMFSFSFPCFSPLGKTTFLNQVHELHHCTYLRQYHTVRPYITVSKIPNFNPRKLPYWKIYEREGIANSIVAGGTYGGKFIAGKTQNSKKRARFHSFRCTHMLCCCFTSIPHRPGLSGGQRKLLLFEMVYQRCRDQSQLLIVFDEPFAGVTGKNCGIAFSQLDKLIPFRGHVLTEMYGSHLALDR